jgi:hypothetical protein
MPALPFYPCSFVVDVEQKIIFAGQPTDEVWIPVQAAVASASASRQQQQPDQQQKNQQQQLNTTITPPAATSTVDSPSETSAQQTTETAQLPSIQPDSTPPHSVSGHTEAVDTPKQPSGVPEQESEPHHPKDLIEPPIEDQAPAAPKQPVSATEDHPTSSQIESKEDDTSKQLVVQSSKQLVAPSSPSSSSSPENQPIPNQTEKQEGDPSSPSPPENHTSPSHIEPQEGAAPKQTSSPSSPSTAEQLLASPSVAENAVAAASKPTQATLEPAHWSTKSRSGWKPIHVKFNQRAKTFAVHSIKKGKIQAKVSKIAYLADCTVKVEKDEQGIEFLEILIKRFDKPGATKSLLVRRTPTDHALVAACGKKMS